MSSILSVSKFSSLNIYVISCEYRSGNLEKCCACICRLWNHVMWAYTGRALRSSQNIHGRCGANTLYVTRIELCKVIIIWSNRNTRPEVLLVSVFIWRKSHHLKCFKRNVMWIRIHLFHSEFSLSSTLWSLHCSIAFLSLSSKQIKFPNRLHVSGV